jgi:hypothetical protein
MGQNANLMQNKVGPEKEIGAWNKQLNCLACDPIGCRKADQDKTSFFQQ